MHNHGDLAYAPASVDSDSLQCLSFPVRFSLWVEEERRFESSRKQELNCSKGSAVVFALVLNGFEVHGLVAWEFGKLPF